jgi:hypothetical protein
MDWQILKNLGQIAGLAGLSLGILYLLFRDIIRRIIFKNLTPEHGYRLLRLIVIWVPIVTVLGLAAWAYSSRQQSRMGTTPEPQPENGVIAGMVVDQQTNLGIGQATITVVGHSEQYSTEDNGNFRLDLLTDKSKVVRLHVVKSGYSPLDLTVRLPAENLTLQLRKP